SDKPGGAVRVALLYHRTTSALSCQYLTYQGKDWVKVG
ncbi:unnamed protein product, partial [marine sediment metagenome]